MKITALIENRVSKHGLVAEHGLSFYIETDSSNLLFDTGASANFIFNAKKLGIDISKIDTLVISHGHIDHIGGLRDFLQVNRQAKIFMKREALNEKFSNGNFIGVPDDFMVIDQRFQFVCSVTEISKGIFILPEIETYFPLDQHQLGFTTRQHHNLIPDEFMDELFLVLKTAAGISIVSSCSHNGISNMVATAAKQFDLPVLSVVGGFHIKNASSLVVDHLCDYFNKINVRDIYTGHCTGINQYAELKSNCQATVHYFETGESINLST